MATHYIDGMAIEIDGDGDPVVCIHGLGGSSNTWTPLMSALRNFKTVRIDLPGSARSAGLTGPLSIQTFVDAAVAVCSQLGLRSAHWLGHSLGTIVCQHLALQQPQRVRSLALFGPLPCPPESARSNIRARAYKAATEGAAGMQAIADAVVQGATSAATREASPVACAAIRESLMRQDPSGYAHTCEALAAAQPASLEDIRAPVLLVCGEDDGVAPPSVGREMHRRIAASHAIVLERCGHWIPFERPADSARALSEFLARI